MFIRFGVAIFLVVLISLMGTALEKRNLELRRELARATYRRDVLLDRYMAERAKAQQLGAPLRTVERLTAEELVPNQANPTRTGKGNRRASPPRGRKA
jgi:hypothetical protein